MFTLLLVEPVLETNPLERESSDLLHGFAYVIRQRFKKLYN